MKKLNNNFKLSGKAILLGMALWTLGSGPISAEEDKNWYAVDENLLAEIRDKIGEHSGEGGDRTALKVWQNVLDGLYGKYSVKNALRQATIGANGNYDDASDLWSRTVRALLVVRDLQLFEYDYNFDPELILVVQNMMNEYSAKGKTGKERTWRNVLMALMGDGDLKKATDKIKSLGKKHRPPEWGRLVDALEGYEDKRATHGVAKGAYSYELYDTETGEKLYSLDIDSDTKQGTGGDYETGKIQWDVRGDTSYLSYGYWARSRANSDENKTYTRDRAVFFHGDAPAGNIDQVRGIAIYKGNTVGVWQRNTTKDGEINGFTGDVDLVANFEEGSVAGYINKLDDPDLPIDKISLGKAYFDSNSRLSGKTRAINGGNAVGYHGEWQGGFFNQADPEDAPGEIGGTYSVSTGKGTSDIDIQGAFGTSLLHHSDTYRRE